MVIASRISGPKRTGKSEFTVNLSLTFWIGKVDRLFMPWSLRDWAWELWLGTSIPLPVLKQSIQSFWNTCCFSMQINNNTSRMRSRQFKQDESSKNKTLCESWKSQLIQNDKNMGVRVETGGNSHFLLSLYFCPMHYCTLGKLEPKCKLQIFTLASNGLVACWLQRRLNALIHLETKVWCLKACRDCRLGLLRNMFMQDWSPADLSPSCAPFDMWSHCGHPGPPESLALQQEPETAVLLY